MPKHNLKKEIYQPAEDSYLLQEQVMLFGKTGKYKNVLDMGTGTGIQAVEASKFADYVVAVDINKEALDIAESNIHKRMINNIKLIKSNLFSKIPKQKFNLIIFNPPYLPTEEPRSIAVDGGRKGYEIIDEFLKQARRYLAKNGIILLIFSTLTGNVEDAMMKRKFKFKKLAEQKLFMERLFVYKLWL